MVILITIDAVVMMILIAIDMMMVAMIMITIDVVVMMILITIGMMMAMVIRGEYRT